MRVPGPGLLAVLTLAVVLVTGPGTCARFALRQGEVSSDTAGQRLLMNIRDAACRGAALQEPPPGPIVLTAWKSGSRAWIGQDRGEATSLASGFEDSGLCDDPTVRLQLDVGTGDGWLPRRGLLLELALVEGHDGVSANVGDQRVWVPPGALVRQGAFGRVAPLGGLEPGMRIGVSRDQLLAAVNDQAASLGIEGRVSDLRRWRSVAVVEDAHGQPVRLYKGTTARPPLTRARLEAATRAGAAYLTRSQHENGRFTYYYDAGTDATRHKGYVWARHVGTCYALAQVGRLLHEPEWIEAAGRGLDAFERTLVDGPDGSTCWSSKNACDLGTSALGLLALSEYRIASGDDHHAPTAARLASFLSSMQRPDGFFFHRWSPSTGIDRKTMWPFASQQAVLALAIHGRAAGDEAALDRAVRGMDYLSGPYWAHLLGRWFVGQEHWTCLAAEEIHATRPDPAHARFCHDIGTFYARVTLGAQSTPWPEDVGGITFTPAITPYAGATATVAEALVSAVALGRATGADTTFLQERLVDSMGFLVQSQVTADDTFWLPAPDRALGGIYDKQSKLRVRVDTVQHSISAMVRAIPLVE